MDIQQIYRDRLAALKAKKLDQTREKIDIEGLLDEDDYGRVVPPKDSWSIIPNHEDGSFYGFDGWTENFCSLMDNHPVYVDSNDAFSGRWAYFMSKMRPNKWNPDYPYDHLKESIDKYDIICGIGDDAHFAPDFKIGLELGWHGLLDKIDKYSAINSSEEQLHFYSIHRRAIVSVQGWISRHIDALEKEAKTELDTQKRENLLATAEVNRNIISEAPKTMREACQWIIWYHLASRSYNRDGAGGQIDTLLQPFYERDIASGVMSRDEAVYFLSCFLLNDPIYWQLGGPDRDGVDQTSEVSFLILEAADLIDTSLNITVRVHDGMDQKLFNRSIYYLVKNKNGWPRFSGDKALVEGFMKSGFDKETARERIAVGCNWMSLPGREYTMNDLVKVNMARLLEISIEEMKQLTTGQLIETSTGVVASVSEGASTELLWEIFKSHLVVAVGTAADGIRHQLMYQKYNEPELILNLLSHGPIEKGCDVSDGGAEFYNLAIDGAGLAVVADSFAALEQRIEVEQRISWDKMFSSIESNYQDSDGAKIKLMMSSSERYGAGNSIGDRWAKQIVDEFSTLVVDQTDMSVNHRFIPGLFSWANTVGFGLNVGATPNGRASGAPISHGANPNPGFVKDGASLALAAAIAKAQPGYGNTGPMQWELDPTLATENHIDVIGSIIKSHFDLGGTLINVNIMDKATVLAAHKDPSKYPELVVRITGFTAYFSMLTPNFRQLVVDRILEN